MINVPEATALAWTRAQMQVREGGRPLSYRVDSCPGCGLSGGFNYMLDLRPGHQFFHCFRRGCNTPFLSAVRLSLGPHASIADALAHLREFGSPCAFIRRAEPGGFSREGADAEMRRAFAAPENFCAAWRFSTDWESGEIPRAILAYARRRLGEERDFKDGRIGFFRRGPLSGRLVFLTLAPGTLEPVHATGRSILDASAPRYKAASLASGADPESVFNAHLAGPETPVVGCEGPLSAEAATRDGWLGVAFLGSSFPARQLAVLAARRPACCIMLREPGVDEDRVAGAVHALCAMGVQAFGADLLSGDPADAPGEFLDVLDGARPMDWRDGALAKLSKHFD